MAVPDIYHEYAEPGEAFSYVGAEGVARGNALKVTKPCSAYDSDSAASVAALAAHPACTGAVGATGFCVGGHLSFRAALTNPDVRSAACFYATDVHKGSLGAGGDDSLALIPNLAKNSAEVLMIWGRQVCALVVERWAPAARRPVVLWWTPPLSLTFFPTFSMCLFLPTFCFFSRKKIRQDPHVPAEGRSKVMAALSSAGVAFSWHEVNGAHAFMRDEGSAGRYDAELALWAYSMVVAFFRRTLTAEKGAGAGEGAGAPAAAAAVSTH